MASTFKHKPWVDVLVQAGLARLEDANITVRDVPNKGDKQEVPFKHVVFLADTPEQFAKVAEAMEQSRGTVTVEVDGKDVEQPDTHPAAKLLTYAYGLNCRAGVRAQFESQFEDPEKGLKKIAEMLVKTGKFKSFEKALAAARLMQEDDE